MTFDPVRTVIDRRSAPGSSGPARRYLAAASLFALGLAGCEDETIGRLSVKAAFAPDTLDFGEVAVGTSRALSVKLESSGTAPFEIDTVMLSPSFSIEGLKGMLDGKAVPTGTPLELEIAFLAAAEGEVRGTLEVQAGAATAVLNLRGVGVIRRMPVLTLEPTALDFGAVELGLESRKDVVFSNSGNAPGTIDRVTLASSGTDVTGTDEYRYDFSLPIVVAEGASVTVPIAFRPGLEGVRSDTMRFQVQGAPATLDLALTGQGRVPLGEILCTPSSLEFGQVERGLFRELSVRCEARGGPARLVTANISGTDGMYFGMPSPPSTIDLTAGSGVDIAVVYRPDGLPSRHSAALNVTYSGGSGTATAVVPLSGEVIPPPPTATAISVILRWDTNFTDVDLHMTRPGGAPFDFIQEGDCYYLVLSPDWGVPGDPSDNPYLDVDDIDGLGPETINLSQTAPGQYTIYAHYFSDHNSGNTTASVEVYIAGNLAGTYTRNLSCDDLWTVGSVSWNGNGGTFNPSNNVLPRSGEGSCL